MGIRGMLRTPATLECAYDEEQQDDGRQHGHGYRDEDDEPTQRQKSPEPQAPGPSVRPYGEPTDKREQETREDEYSRVFRQSEEVRHRTETRDADGGEGEEVEFHKYSEKGLRTIILSAERRTSNALESGVPHGERPLGRTI